jgi:hypothetical protein
MGLLALWSTKGFGFVVWLETDLPGLTTPLPSDPSISLESGGGTRRAVASSHSERISFWVDPLGGHSQPTSQTCFPCRKRFEMGPLAKITILFPIHLPVPGGENLQFLVLTK